MNINYDDDFIFYNDNYDKEDQLVDISNSEIEENIITPTEKSRCSGNGRHGRRNTKPLIIACCVAGVVLLGTSIAGVAIMNRPEENKVVEQAQSFTYPEGTVVSGISLAGKT